MSERSIAPEAELDARVRLAVYRNFVERGHAPAHEDLARELAISRPQLVDSLRRLAAGRALILGKDGERIAVVPPFSAAPTPFWVETSRGSWWGNCAWEALGIAALLECDATIRTTSGACGEALEIRVRDGVIHPQSVCMHIAVPAARWWDDVAFTCGTILFFRSESDVDRWCDAHGIARGAVLSTEQAWKLARTWFAGRFELDWRRLTPDEARRSLADAGLTGDFWRLA